MKKALILALLAGAVAYAVEIQMGAAVATPMTKARWRAVVNDFHTRAIEERNPGARMVLQTTADLAEEGYRLGYEEALADAVADETFLYRFEEGP